MSIRDREYIDPVLKGWINKSLVSQGSVLCDAGMVQNGIFRGLGSGFMLSGSVLGCVCKVRDPAQFPWILSILEAHKKHAHTPTPKINIYLMFRQLKFE